MTARIPSLVLRFLPVASGHYGGVIKDTDLHRLEVEELVCGLAVFSQLLRLGKDAAILANYAVIVTKNAVQRQHVALGQRISPIALLLGEKSNASGYAPRARASGSQIRE